MLCKVKQLKKSKKKLGQNWLHMPTPSKLFLETHHSHGQKIQIIMTNNFLQCLSLSCLRPGLEDISGQVTIKHHAVINIMLWTKSHEAIKMSCCDKSFRLLLLKLNFFKKMWLRWSTVLMRTTWTLDWGALYPFVWWILSPSLSN